MKKIFFVFLCILILAALARLGFARAPEVAGPGTDVLLGAVRTMNTFEVMYSSENGRYASREELLAFLEQKGVLLKIKMNLRDPEPYQLTVTTSNDGKHYQIGLKRLADPNEKGTRCKTAVFSDDAGVIFIGSALDCEAAAQ